MAKLQDKCDELLANTMVKYASRGKEAATLACMEIFPEMSNKMVAAAFMRGKLSSGMFRHRVSELLDKQGYNLHKINERVGKALMQQKPVVTKDGIQWYDDGNVQLRAAQQLYELHGVLGRTDKEQELHEGGELRIAGNKEELERLRGIVRELADLNDRLSEDEYQQRGKVIDTKGVTTVKE